MTVFSYLFTLLEKVCIDVPSFSILKSKFHYLYFIIEGKYKEIKINPNIGIIVESHSYTGKNAGIHLDIYFSLLFTTQSIFFSFSLKGEIISQFSISSSIYSLFLFCY
jgi:hypothetical protein